MSGADPEKFFKCVAVERECFISADTGDFRNAVLCFFQHPAGVEQSCLNDKIHGAVTRVFFENTVQCFPGNFKKIQ